MRLIQYTPALALLVASRAAAGSPFTNRASTLDVRTTSDVCANLVNQPLRVTRDPAVPPITIGLISVCLCASGVANFLNTNVVARTAAEASSNAVAAAAITALITAHAPDAMCLYPVNAVPACAGTNPCGFTCTNGYTATATGCICPAPQVVCNGVCGAPGPCATTLPPLQRERRFEGSGAGWMACGVFGGAARAWECVDTARDLESCGGCALPLTPYTPVGADCTAIPGVADVACEAGACAVRRCLPGYVPSADAAECVRIGEERAADYGLEHRPLML